MTTPPIISHLRGKTGCPSSKLPALFQASTVWVWILTVSVIRTAASAMLSRSKKRTEQWLSESSLQQLVRMMQHHESSYHRIQQFIENPPGDLRIFEIFPPKPLASHALGSRLPALNQDYHLGRRCARYFLSAASHWFIPRDNEHTMPFITPRKARPKRVVLPQENPDNVIPLAAAASSVEQIILDPAVLTDMVADGGMVRPAASAFHDDIQQAEVAHNEMPQGEEHPYNEGENL